jgi:hypothetical protein
MVRDESAPYRVAPKPEVELVENNLS